MSALLAIGIALVVFCAWKLVKLGRDYDELFDEGE